MSPTVRHSPSCLEIVLYRLQQHRFIRLDCFLLQLLLHLVRRRTVRLDPSHAVPLRTGGAPDQPHVVLSHRLSGQSVQSRLHHHSTIHAQRFRRASLAYPCMPLRCADVVVRQAHGTVPDVSLRRRTSVHEVLVEGCLPRRQASNALQQRLPPIDFSRYRSDRLRTTVRSHTTREKQGATIGPKQFIATRSCQCRLQLLGEHLNIPVLLSFNEHRSVRRHHLVLHLAVLVRLYHVRWHRPGCTLDNHSSVLWVSFSAAGIGAFKCEHETLFVTCSKCPRLRVHPLDYTPDRR